MVETLKQTKRSIIHVAKGYLDTQLKICLKNE